MSYKFLICPYVMPTRLFVTLSLFLLATITTAPKNFPFRTHFMTILMASFDFFFKKFDNPRSKCDRNVHCQPSVENQSLLSGVRSRGGAVPTPTPAPTPGF